MSSVIPVAPASNNIYVKLSNGKTIPAVGFGTWQIAPDTCKQVVYEAIKIGYRHIDGARVYCNEEAVGDAIARAIKDGLVKREELFVTTKLWNTDHDQKDVEKACRASLKRLGMDHVDLYLVHWPTHWKKDDADEDELMPLDAECKVALNASVTIPQLWAEMEKLVELGLTKSIGVSNFSAEQVDEVLKVAKVKPVANQVESHPFFPQFKLEEHCKSNGIILQAYSPLAANAPDPLDPVQKRPELLADPAIVAVAKKHGVSPAQVALRFHVDLGRVVLPKSVSVNRIKENFDVLQFKLDAEDLAALRKISETNSYRTLNPSNFGKDGLFFS